MFDNLRDEDSGESLLRSITDESQKTLSPKKKRVIRFRSPIDITRSIVEWRLERFLQEESLREGSIDFDDTRDLDKPVYLVRAFVRDADNREYSARVPKILVNLIRNIQLKHNA